MDHLSETGPLQEWSCNFGIHDTSTQELRSGVSDTLCYLKVKWTSYQIDSSQRIPSYAHYHYTKPPFPFVTQSLPNGIRVCQTTNLHFPILFFIHVRILFPILAYYPWSPLSFRKIFNFKWLQCNL